jgi:hypothetical protein
MSYEDASAILKIAVRTIRSRLSREREALRPTTPREHSTYPEMFRRHLEEVELADELLEMRHQVLPN